MSKLRFKNILIFSLTANLLTILGIGYYISKKGGFTYLQQKMRSKATCDEQKQYSFYYLSKLSLFRQLPNFKQDIYFVGDSITDYGEWHELLSTSDAKNRGINGDTTVGIFNRLDEIIEGKPLIIFIMCGINDIIEGCSIGQSIENYGNILSELQSIGAKTHIYVQSVLPINKNKYKQNVVKKYPGTAIPNNSDVKRFNTFLNALTENHPNTHYLDLSLLLDNNGEVKADYTIDGLHLNGKGMYIWARVIKRFLPQNKSDNGMNPNPS